jgi:hypothetical protein
MMKAAAFLDLTMAGKAFVWSDNVRWLWTLLIAEPEWLASFTF